MREIRKEDIPSLTFVQLAVVEYPGRQSVSYLMNASDLANLPPESYERLIELRKRLDYIFHTVLKGNYNLLYEDCDLNETTFRKFIKGSRRLSKTNLVKFIIGTGLDQVIAEELLSMNETPFDYDNRFDCIVACAIRDGDSIDMLHQELVLYGCKGLTEDI